MDQFLNKESLLRKAASVAILFLGYKMVQRAESGAQVRMREEVPRCRSLEDDPVFDGNTDWRRHLCAMDSFCTHVLPPPADAWSLALTDAFARLVRLNAISAVATHTDASIRTPLLLPPVVSEAANACTERIFACLTALENVVLEQVAAAVGAPSIQDASRLVNSVAGFEESTGSVVESMPRAAVELYKTFVDLAREIKSMSDLERANVERIRSMRAAMGARYTLDGASSLPPLLLTAVEDALALAPLRDGW